MSLESLLSENPTLKRLAVGVMTGAVVALNKKLGLDLETSDILALVGLAVSMITGSNWKEAKLAGAEAAKAIATTADAKTELEK